MTNILITGGAGFIGSSLAGRLAENPSNNIVVVDNFLTGVKKHIPTSSNCQFIKCDVNEYREIAPIMSATKFDYVFHYAAVVGVDRTLENPILVLKDIDGIKNILDLCKSTNVKRIFFASSSEVYGEPVETPQNELNTPLNARLPYAIVKNIGESFLRSYQQEHGLEYTIFRFFNTYGPKQSDDFVISRFIDKALNDEDLTIFGDGSQTRTFCYVDDNLDATIKCMTDGICVNDEINIGSGKEMTILELAETVIKTLNSSSKITFLPARKQGDMMRRQPDNEKMLQVLDRTLLPLSQGLLKVAEARQLANIGVKCDEFADTPIQNLPQAEKQESLANV